MTTQKVLKAYYPPDEFELVIIYGPLGYGKSSYAVKVLAECLGAVYKIENEQKLWENVKQLLVFHPEQFFSKVDEIESQDIGKVPSMVWDDAGLWLYALDWDDPFVKAVGKYLNVVRTHFASMICTTPSPTWIFKKLRGFPQALTIKIMKCSGSRGHEWQRLARAYKHWGSPDLKKTGVRRVHEDYFNCRMPDPFYNWYKPIRDAYEDMALKLMKEQWEKTKSNSAALLLQDYPQLQVPSLSLPKIQENVEKI